MKSAHSNAEYSNRAHKPYANIRIPSQIIPVEYSILYPKRHGILEPILLAKYVFRQRLPPDHECGEKYVGLINSKQHNINREPLILLLENACFDVKR